MEGTKRRAARILTTVPESEWESSNVKDSTDRCWLSS